MERDPAATFYEWELAPRFPDGLRAALTDGILRSIPRREGGRVRLATGRTVVVAAWDGESWGLDDAEPQMDPVALAPEDLTCYQLSVEAVAQLVQEANGLAGDYCRLDARLHYLGARSADNARVSVVLALFAEDDSALRLALSVPSHLSTGHDEHVLLCPSFRFRDQDKLRRLEDAGVLLGGLAEQADWEIAWPSGTVRGMGPSAGVILTIEGGGLMVRYAGVEVKLTPLERRVLCRLAEHPGRPVAEGDLREAGWPPDGDVDSAYTRHVIRQLRSKFRQAGERALGTARELPESLIETKRGRDGGGSAYRLQLKPREVHVSD